MNIHDVAARLRVLRPAATHQVYAIGDLPGWIKKVGNEWQSTDASKVYTERGEFLIGWSVTNVDALPTIEEIEAAPTPPEDAVQEGNVRAASKRSRAADLEELERRMSRGAPQEEINRQLLDLLKE